MCLFKAYHFGSWAQLAIYCNWNVRKNVPQHRKQILVSLYSPKTENTPHYVITSIPKNFGKKNCFKSCHFSVMASYSLRAKKICVPTSRGKKSETLLSCSHTDQRADNTTLIRRGKIYVQNKRAVCLQKRSPSELSQS